MREWLLIVRADLLPKPGYLNPDSTGHLHSGTAEVHWYGQFRKAYLNRAAHLHKLQQGHDQPYHNAACPSLHYTVTIAKPLIQPRLSMHRVLQWQQDTIASN